MRLLKRGENGDFCLTEDLIGNTFPKYAILSHTWGDEEVTFKDMVEGTGKGKTGYGKIKFCAGQAERDNLQYFWVDTCCIDKSNNTELSEAINSMYRWYRDAARCYVYLTDVSIIGDKQLGKQHQPPWKSAFQISRWFTRGWTLQELLAPASVEFFTKEGAPVGDKRSLEQQIHNITRIPIPALQGTPLSQFEVNERFAWAEARQTIREEDWAYCLLGIFGVFVPLIYGEGREHAIGRLKKEVYNNLSDLHHTTVTKVKQEKLIKSLKFSSMREREHTITESFIETFQWIFSSDLHPFAEWLRCDAGIFWISGKPGAGKSTLMKFIVQDPRTKDLLKPGTLLLRHYLWMPGHEMQRSIKGTLCILLYQLLCSEKSLVEGLLSDLDASDSIDSVADWTIPILKRSLISSLRSCLWPVCLFLDGLDEISSADGPHELIDLIRELSGIPRLKICLASRPDPVFKGEYSRHPNLKLQDLTDRDIRKVCEKSIEVLKKSIPEDWTVWGSPPTDWDRQLTNELVTRADGVFLWLHLALKSIRRGLAKSDSWELILQRARGLPADLDQLYQSMWMRANVDRGIYERSAASYFNLIIESALLMDPFNSGSISAFDLIVASESKLQELIFEGKGRLIEIKKLFEFGIRKLEAHSAGLIELISATEEDTVSGTILKPIYRSSEWDDLVPFRDFRVKFIHRTASDFLTDTEQGRAILGLDATSRQDKLVALIRAAITGCSLWRKKFPLHDELEDFQFLSLTILATTISEIEKQKLFRHLEHGWYRIVREPADFSTRDTAVAPLPDFLGFSASLNASAYVISRFEEIQSTHRKLISQDYKNYLLQQATGFFYRIPETHEWQSQLHLIRFLLSQGARPDHATYLFVHIREWVNFEGIYVTTPISNIIQEVLGAITVRGVMGVIRKSNPLGSDLCHTIKLAMQSSDARESQVTLPITFNGRMQFPSYLDELSEQPQIIILETNIVFHIQLLLDILMIKHKGIVQSPEFIDLETTVKEEFIRNRQISATAKVVLFNDHRHSGPDPSKNIVLLAPASVDPDGLRLKIRQTFQCKSYYGTEIEMVKEGIYDMMYEAAAGNNVLAKSKTEIWEALKHHRFPGWPAPEEHRKVWPPPIWPSE
jgi:hypothetical protein